MRIAAVGRDQIGENLDPGHHRQDADITADRKMDICRAEGLQGEFGQVKAGPEDRGDNHGPQQQEYTERRRAKGACCHARTAVNQPAG